MLKHPRGDQPTQQANILMKAQVATIDLGFAKFDGLMLPDGSYAIAVPQIAELIQFDKNQASRDFKALLGNGFQFAKASTELNPKAVNIVDVTTFRLILRKLDKQGNAIATALIDAFIEESVDRRLDTAFGKKVSEVERNEILALRMKRLLARHAWTDVLRDRHIQCFGTKPTPSQYKAWTVQANKVLFNKAHFNCDRDTMQTEEQRIIEMFENMAIRRADQNPSVDPSRLLELALDTF